MTGLLGAIAFSVAVISVFAWPVYEALTEIRDVLRDIRDVLEEEEVDEGGE